MSHSSEVEAFLDLFRDYRDLASGEFRRFLSFRRVPKGTFLCHVDEALSDLIFLLEGRARVYLPLFDGREYLFRIYQRGDVVGDLEFFLGQAAMCSVQCAADVRVASFPVETIRERRTDLPDAILALGRGIAEKLRQNSISVAVSTGYTARVRLAAHFLSSSDPRMAARNLKELSDWLGISYRHLTRTLARLVAEGGLSKHANGYTVRDRELLGKIASDIMQDEPPRF